MAGRRREDRPDEGEADQNARREPAPAPRRQAACRKDEEDQEDARHQRGPAATADDRSRRACGEPRLGLREERQLRIEVEYASEKKPDACERQRPADEVAGTLERQDRADDGEREHEEDVRTETCSLGGLVRAVERDEEREGDEAERQQNGDDATAGGRAWLPAHACSFRPLQPQRDPGADASSRRRRPRALRAAVSRSTSCRSRPLKASSVRWAS